MLKRKAADLASDDAKKPKANGSITAFFGQPKPAAAGGAAKPDAAVAVAKKFDKEAWVAKLTEEQRELLKLEIETMDESWLAVLKEELVTEGFLKLKRFLKSEKEAGKKVFPPEAEIYSWYDIEDPVFDLLSFNSIAFVEYFQAEELRQKGREIEMQSSLNHCKWP